MTSDHSYSYYYSQGGGVVLLVGLPRVWRRTVPFVLTVLRFRRVLWGVRPPCHSLSETRRFRTCPRRGGLVDPESSSAAAGVLVAATTTAGPPHHHPLPDDSMGRRPRPPPPKSYHKALFHSSVRPGLNRTWPISESFPQDLASGFVRDCFPRSTLAMQMTGGIDERPSEPKRIPGVSRVP